MKKIKYIVAAIIVVAIGILTYFYVNKINGEGIIIITAVGDSDEFSNNTGVDNIGVHQIYDYESDEEYSNRQSFVDWSMNQVHLSKTKSYEH